MPLKHGKTKEIDIHDRTKRLESAKAYLQNYTDLSEDAKKLINDYVTYKASGQAPSLLRQVKYYRYLPNILKHLPEDLYKTKTEDITECFTKLFNEDIKPTTKRDRLELTRGFFKWLLDDESEVLKLFKRVPRPKMPVVKINLQDLISWEECLKMSRATKNLLGAAFIQCLWDSGMRLEEIMTLDVGSIEHVMNGRGVVLHLRKSKTVIRSVAVPLAAGALLQYLTHEHPKKDDPTAPLWIIKYNGVMQPPTGRWANKLLQETAARAGVKGKKVNPHSFRKASASYYCQHLNDSQLKARYGWVADTKVLRHYVARDEDAANTKVFQSAGLVEEERKPFVNENKCWQCGQENPAGWRECVNCGRSLNPDMATLEVESLARLEMNWKVVREKYKDEADIALQNIAKLLVKAEIDGGGVK